MYVKSVYKDNDDNLAYPDLSHEELDYIVQALWQVNENKIKGPDVLNYKIIDIINRQDLNVKPDGTICWRSSMDAGGPDPIIGKNIKDIM